MFSYEYNLTKIIQPNCIVQENVRTCTYLLEAQSNQLLLAYPLTPGNQWDHELQVDQWDHVHPLDPNKGILMHMLIQYSKTFACNKSKKLNNKWKDIQYAVIHKTAVKVYSGTKLQKKDKL